MVCENAQRGTEITGSCSFPTSGLWRTGALQEGPHIINSFHVVARLACLILSLLMWLKMTFLNAAIFMKAAQILAFTGFKE